jgi:hypothetical protein
MNREIESSIHIPQAETDKARQQRIGLELRDLHFKLGIPQIVELVFQLELSEEERHAIKPQLGTAPLVKLVADLRSISIARATVDLAHAVDLIDDGCHRRLLRELGESASAASEQPNRPVWDRDANELRFRGKVVRQIRSITVAKNVVAILDAFEEAGWQNRHVDNLPAPLDDDPQKLREAVATLNEGLETDDLWFKSDGTGHGVLVRFKQPFEVRPKSKKRRKAGAKKRSASRR